MYIYLEDTKKVGWGCGKIYMVFTWLIYSASCEMSEGKYKQTITSEKVGLQTRLADIVQIQNAIRLQLSQKKKHYHFHLKMRVKAKDETTNHIFCFHSERNKELHLTTQCKTGLLANTIITVV